MQLCHEKCHEKYNRGRDDVATRLVLEPGDRIRVIAQDSAYTGCRGTVVEDPGSLKGVTPLGYYVAIDGENGRSRPFLSHELQRLVAARVRRSAVESERKQQA